MHKATTHIKSKSVANSTAANKKNVLVGKRPMATVAAIIQYVIPLGGNGWMVRNSKATRFTVITDNKREAVTIARSIAKTKRRTLIVYARNGSVEVQESYVV